MISRRSFFGGFAGLLAAPAIVKAASLMPVKALPSKWPLEIGEWRHSRALEEVIRILDQESEILSGMTWVESRSTAYEFSVRIGIRTGIPAATWRSLAR